MSVAVATFEPSDRAALDAACQMAAAVRAVDLPDLPPLPRQQAEGDLTHPMPGTTFLTALATRNGAPAGYLRLALSHRENLDNADVELAVHPAHRRGGVGRALYEHAVRVLREQGRKRLLGTSVGPLADGAQPSAGAAFASALGAQPALLTVRRRLVVGEVDRAAHDALLAEAYRYAAGYRLVSWRNVTPEEYVADIARLEHRLLTDAPSGDLVVEAVQSDADRIRATERVWELRQWRTYHCGLVHEATGRLVAWTMAAVRPGVDQHAGHQATIVDPDHRGRRLGILAKIEHLRYLLTQEPEIRDVDTWNAASNQHMIAINEQLGFRAVDGWTHWQLDL